jgi:subtilisin family serine protease
VPARRRSLTAIVVVLALSFLVGPIGAGAVTGKGLPSHAANTIDPKLLQRFAKAPMQTFVVEFTGRANLSKAAGFKDFTRRGVFVMDALRATASRSQRPALRLVARTAGADARSYWIVNEMIVRGRAALARSLAALPGVHRIRAPKQYKLVKPVRSAQAAVPQGGDPEWGVAKVGADQVWDEGILGQGVVVANLDTGVDFRHPALVDHYRGNNGDSTFTHDYNWWDPTGICGESPCDNAAHGTHTMGTMVGGDGPGPFAPDIGVAPGAKWIAAKGCRDFGCSEQALISGGQFLLAPTDLGGHNPDPSKRPDVINNSWGSDDPFDSFLAGIVESWRAAGIVPVFSIGNAGEFGCGSAGSPGNFANVIGVGATDIDDQIASFSSLGPPPDGRTKPDVSAPGVDVTSSVPGGGYESFDGTSMAAPHTSGAVALMLSAQPALRGQLDAVADSLESTALDRPDGRCGGDEDGDPNQVYGDGRVDALAAVMLVRTGGTLAGSVTDAGTSLPIAGAIVSARANGREFTAVTDASGAYRLFLAARGYKASAGAFGYHRAGDTKLRVRKDQIIVQSFALAPLPRFDIRGTVRALESGKPLPRISVQVLDVPIDRVTTDGAGQYSLTVPVGKYAIRVSAGGCTNTVTRKVQVIDKDVTLDAALDRKIDRFGHGCATTAFTWVEALHDTGLMGDEFVGNLHLPFAFPFYGASYSEVFLSDNGYIDFLAPDQYNALPVETPSPLDPNAAVYAVWEDLYVGPGGGVRWDLVGTAPNRAYVIEYSKVSAYGGADPLSFEIKLWENGTVDLLYGDNHGSVADGSNGLAGIENADGTNALQMFFYEPVLGPNQSYRFAPAPAGTVHGVVTDANDGQPPRHRVPRGQWVSDVPGGQQHR